MQSYDGGQPKYHILYTPPSHRTDGYPACNDSNGIVGFVQERGPRRTSPMTEPIGAPGTDAEGAIAICAEAATEIPRKTITERAAIPRVDE